MGGVGSNGYALVSSEPARLLVDTPTDIRVNVDWTNSVFKTAATMVLTVWWGYDPMAQTWYKPVKLAELTLPVVNGVSDATFKVTAPSSVVFSTLGPNLLQGNPTIGLSMIGVPEGYGNYGGSGPYAGNAVYMDLLAVSVPSQLQELLTLTPTSLPNEGGTLTVTANGLAAGPYYISVWNDKNEIVAPNPAQHTFPCSPAFVNGGSCDVSVYQGQFDKPFSIILPPVGTTVAYYNGIIWRTGPLVAGIYTILSKATIAGGSSVSAQFNLGTPPVKRVIATVTVTAGFPAPTVTLQLLIDGQVVDVEIIDASTYSLNQPFQRAWTIGIGRTVKVHAHFENPLGQFDADSSSVTT